MKREQGAQRGQMVTVESSEVRRASQSDRQCVKEWRLWRKEQKGGERRIKSKKEKNSIKSNSKKETKGKSEWKRVAPITKLNPGQDKLSKEFMSNKEGGCHTALHLHSWTNNPLGT